MDYEKAYKAVLQTATQWIKDGCTDKEKICLECVFPELRESEDERIRKWILEKVQEYADSGIPCSDEIQMANNALAYIEKQKEQKSADEQFPPLEGLDAIKAKYYDNGFKNGFDEGVASVKPEDRFEEAREKYQVEWSEEDERIIDTIVSILGQYIDYKAVSGTGSGYATPRYSKEIDFLKSIRPSWQNTYKQVVHTIFKMLKGKDFYGIPSSSCVSLLNDIRVKCKDAIECAPILDEPSWKPSEEQIYSLGTVMKGYNECTVGSVGYHLKEMYEQLKKLM